jgi:hypothetical protein
MGLLGSTPIDIRYTADAATTASTPRLLLPLRVRVRRPTCAEALAEVRTVVDQFRLLAERAETLGGRLQVADLAASTDKPAGNLSFQKVTKKEVLLELEFLAVVGFASVGDFWNRASVVAWALDLVQQFCLRSWSRGVEVDALRARFGIETTTAPVQGQPPLPS